MCPYLGCSIDKECFRYGREKLPPAFETYLSYMKKIDLRKAENLTDLFAYDKAMVVQDPFELIHNVTKVNIDNIIVFTKFLRFTFRVSNLLLVNDS